MRQIICNTLCLNKHIPQIIIINIIISKVAAEMLYRNSVLPARISIQHFVNSNVAHSILKMYLTYENKHFHIFTIIYTYISYIKRFTTLK